MQSTKSAGSDCESRFVDSPIAHSTTLRRTCARPRWTRLVHDAQNRERATPRPLAGQLPQPSKALRTQIDKLDLQILKLVNERAGLAAEIGRLKNDHGGEVFSPAREEEVLKNVLRSTTRTRGRSTDATVRAVFREIMSGSRALQKVLKVAYLGPEYSFSHLAAVERFGQAVEFMRRRQHRGRLRGGQPRPRRFRRRAAGELDRRPGRRHARHVHADAAPDQICAEVRLRIHHNLLANCEQQEIRRVYSKPQALSQCRNWLSKNVPQALAERGVQHGRRRPSWPSASRAPPPSPAGRRPSATACASSSRTSRIRRTTRRASPSSATRSAARPATTRRPSCSGCRTTPARWSRRSTSSSRTRST